MNDLKSKFDIYYLNVIKGEYASFEGRVGQKKYWMFFLFYIAIAGLISIIDSILNTSFLGNIYTLVILLPFIGLGIRRMHDTNHSGWFILVPFYNLYLAIIPGDNLSNKYGSETTE